MLNFIVKCLHISSFLAVFLTVLVTNPQHRWDTQAGLPHPWVGVASGSHVQQTIVLPDLQDTGKHPELQSPCYNFLYWKIFRASHRKIFQTITQATVPHVRGDSLGSTRGTLGPWMCGDEWKCPLLTVPKLILFVFQQLLTAVLPLAAGQCHDWPMPNIFQTEVKYFSTYISPDRSDPEQQEKKRKKTLVVDIKKDKC